MTNILIVGSFAPYTLETSYRRAFESLGHTVSAFDFDREFKRLSLILRSRVGGRLSRKSYRMRRALSATYNRSLIEQCRLEKPRLVLVVVTYYLFPETILSLREFGCRVVAYQPDNPFPPYNSSVPETLPTAMAFDLYFVWSEILASQLRARGIPAKFLPFGWDPVLTPHRPPDSPSNSPVVFIGGWDREREAFLEALLRDVKIDIWGAAYWGTRTAPGSRARRAWKGRLLMETEMAAAYSHAPISLNILRKQQQFDGVYDGVIMRTFEVPGAGGFLLATRARGATELFPEAETGAYFDSVENCATRIDHYLTNPRLRLEISERAHQLVDGRHRYSHRAQEILDMVESLS